MAVDYLKFLVHSTYIYIQRSLLSFSLLLLSVSADFLSIDFSPPLLLPVLSKECSIIKLDHSDIVLSCMLQFPLSQVDKKTGKRGVCVCVLE